MEESHSLPRSYRQSPVPPSSPALRSLGTPIRRQVGSTTATYVVAANYHVLNQLMLEHCYGNYGSYNEPATKMNTVTVDFKGRSRGKKARASKSFGNLLDIEEPPRPRPPRTFKVICESSPLHCEFCTWMKISHLPIFCTLVPTSVRAD